MAPSTRDTSDPNALISTILAHLPSFRNKPEIATAAFQTIRRASLTSGVPKISAILLTPLTALSLNSTSATIRSHATSVCLLLLRCLVLRRLRNIAAAYVEDVVKLAYKIVEHGNNEYVLCSLPDFNKVAAESTDPREIFPSLPDDVFHLPTSSIALKALLHLLALLIPSCLSLEQPQSGTNPESSETGNFSIEAVTTDAIKLWKCIGARAQAKVLNLASSQALLSGRCGYEVASTAIHVWERAFDPAACFVVPPSLQQNLRLVVNEVLRDTYLQQKDVLAAQPVRAGLYRLCQLSDPDGRIDSVTWSECGIREAALPETDLSLQLRSFSKSGFIHSYVLQTETVKNNDCAEPPTKKRRVGNIDNSSSIVPERTLESGERTQTTASDYRRMTVHGLFQSVKALPRTDVCAKEPQSMLMLANACCLASDYIHNIVLDNDERIESIREWISFASSLSQIGQDLVGNENVEFENRPLGALAVFARGCLRLGLVLMELRSRLNATQSTGRVDGTEFVEATSMALMSVVLNAYTYGSVCVEHPENPYPALQFAQLLGDLINAIEEGRIQRSTIAPLKTCCERFMQGVFAGNLALETKCIVLPVVLRMSRCHKVFQPGVPIESSLDDICIYISNFNSTQVLAKGCLAMLCEAICFNVRCEHLHEIRQSSFGESFCKQHSHLDERKWNTVYKALRKLKAIIRDDTGITDLLNCVGRLCIHSPRPREKESLEFFMSFLENGSTGILSHTMELLPVLLTRCDPVLLRNVVQDEVDPEDPDGLNTPGSANKEKEDYYASFGRKVIDGAKKFVSAAVRGVDEEANSSYLSLCGGLLWTSFQIPTSQLFGLVVTGLLARTIAELNPISFDESMCTNAQSVREFFLEANIPCTLPAWNHLLMAASVIGNEFLLPSSSTFASKKFGEPFSDQDQGLSERRSLNQLVCDLLNPRLREIFPRCIKQLLHDPTFSGRMRELVSEGNGDSFWARVTRHTVVHLLKEGDRSTLEELASEVERPIETLVERASADVLAMAFMNDTSGLSLKTDGSNGLILSVLDLSLEEVVRKRFGKIVQRLVMEFGGPKESSAKHGLVALSAFMPNRNSIDPSVEQISGVLITSNFMLVMDAVNRGLFNSKTTSQDMRRHLRMLEMVLMLSSDQLHLFVPKVMATLKMALDVTKADNALYIQTLTLWKSFLGLLGSQRVIPHLGTIFAILIPVRYDQGNMLLNELKRVIHTVSPEHVREKPSLLLLLRIMKEVVFHDTKNLNQAYGRVHPDKSVSIEELHEVCKNIESIIGHHENENIETYASRYLLCILRNHRRVLNTAMPCDAELAQENRDKDLGLIAGMLETLLAQLGKTKSVECQDVLVQCIGEIGAIDPGLLPQYQNANSSGLNVGGVTKQSYPKSIHGFATVLLNDFLVTALRKGEKQESSKSQFNRVGLVIQEILRVCGCNKSTPAKLIISGPEKSSPQLGGDEWESVLVRLPADEKATMFWESLSSTTRDAVQPYLAVPFDVNQYCMIFGESAARSVSPACQPVWSKVRALVPLGRGVTAQEWIRQISVQLVDFVGKQGQFGELLRALRPILRYEDQVNNYIFPLVVATALDLQHSLKLKEVKEFIIGEIKEVLTEATSPQSVFDLLDTLRTWRDRRSERRGAQTYNASYTRSAGGNGGQTSSRKRIPMEKFMDLSVANDPLTSLVDLYGRGSKSLSLLTQARAALASRSHYRAIMLAEYHIRHTRASTGFPGWASYIGTIRGRARKSDIYNSNSETKALEVLQEAFANIEDVPNMEAMAKLRFESTLTEVICDSEAAGKYDEALTMYEHALAEEPRSATLHNGFLSCLMTLGHWETMLSHAEGLISSSTLREAELRQTAKAHGIAAAWRLGRWEKLGDLRDVVVETSPFHANEEQAEAPWLLGYSTNFANMLLCFRNGELEALEKESSLARGHLIQPLLRAARESYHRAYPIITLVHSLSEAEDAARYHLLSAREKSIVEGQGSNGQRVSVSRLISDPKRIQCTSRSLKVREPLLSSRRVLFGLLSLPDEAAKAHVELAKLAKEGGNLKAASASAQRALLTKNVNSDVIYAANIESAHIRRAHGDVSEALQTAKREIDRLRGKLDRCISQRLDGEEKSVMQGQLCTALVLAGTWSEETRYETSERIVRYYEEATKYGANREEPFYALGKHFDSLLQAGANADSTAAETSDLGGKTHQSSEDDSSSEENYQQYVPSVIRSFAKALSNGHKRVFEALPRMLTVWFDFHTALHDVQTASLCLPYEPNVKTEMKLAMRSIPSYMWVTAIPQLMSRILHPRMEVRDALRDLLASVVVNYPDQCFWMILPSSQLRNQERKKATTEILNAAVVLLKRPRTKECREHAKAFKVRASAALNVVRLFVNICITQLPKELRGKKEKCGKEFSTLRKTLKARDNPKLIIPTLRSLSVQLPDDSGGPHRPFGAERVSIADIKDEVLVMSSLMRPRRISLIGSDGLEYRYLAKRENQGDMRKDSRMVEFLTVVNRLLARDEGSRGKKLELKTYAVVPLSEETGMIEWVDDLEALRNVVRCEHNWLGQLPDAAHIFRQYQNAATKRQFLEEWAFEKFPPVMDRYFVRKFGGGAEARTWLRARNTWTESCAVWSMAGYIVGLGDRHGENVLVDSTSGRCVHVDFAMLFDKGQTLKVPEIVPFRLTRNMVTVMGVGGYEGLYRAVAETVLGAMRRNWEAVVGVLESFLHDPLADWRGSATEGGSREGREMRAAALAKLRGTQGATGLALSIGGQVERLVCEATDVERLSRMYIWWAAWM